MYIQNWDSQEGRDSCLKINKYFEISNFEISSNSFSYDMPGASNIKERKRSPKEICKRSLKEIKQIILKNALPLSHGLLSFVFSTVHNYLLNLNLDRPLTCMIWFFVVHTCMFFAISSSEFQEACALAQSDRISTFANPETINQFIEDKGLYPCHLCCQSSSAVSILSMT